MQGTVKDAAILLGILAGMILKIQLPMSKGARTDYTKF
jgi:hypothetical protein